MFWLAVIGLGLGGYMLFSFSDEIGFGGKPTPTKAGAEDDKGPQLRQYVDNLYAKLKAQGLAFDEWGVDWKTVLFFYKDPVAEAVVKAAALLPEGSVDLDAKFYHFEAMAMKPKIKTPKWASELEEE